MTKLEKELLNALTIFTDCPDWRRFVHDMDCGDPGGHNDFPNTSLCVCEGPYNVKVIESALKAAGNPIKYEGTD